jgi:hypothetical protein
MVTLFVWISNRTLDPADEAACIADIRRLDRERATPPHEGCDFDFMARDGRAGKPLILQSRVHHALSSWGSQSWLQAGFQPASLFRDGSLHDACETRRRRKYVRRA